jgi:two-component system, NtrC family, sensor kinase
MFQAMSRTRLMILLQLAAAAVVSAPVLAIAVAGRRSGRLEPGGVLLLVAVAAAAQVAVGALLLTRWLAGPLERLLSAAARLGSAEGLPALGPPGEEGGPGLARAAVAFERTAAALTEERARLAAKVAELEAATARLSEAREGLLRSERLATVGRLAAGIAHEVGNPLGAISGYADLARERLVGPRADLAAADDFLARIAAETGRIDAIVRDLLDFARPTALATGPVSLPTAIDAALRLARVQARFRDVELHLDLPTDLPAVLAEERRLAQVVLNLLLNAADAMHGRGEVRVVARSEGASVVVEVSDTGPGISDEALPKVFDPFFTTKEPGQGTGLGLAVCHGIMESFGGAIVAERSATGGALLRLTLRRAE